MNTEDIKSLSKDNKKSDKYQQEIIQEHLAEQQEIIDDCESIIARESAKLSLALKTKEFYQSQLSSVELKEVNHTDTSNNVPYTPKKNKRQQQREQLTEQVKEALVALSKNDVYGNKGFMVGEIRDYLINSDPDIRVSPNTIGHIIKDLIGSNYIMCINPQQTRHRRYAIVKEN